MTPTFPDSPANHSSALNPCNVTTPTARPILFSGQNPRAILDGRKTQTRRATNPKLEPLILSSYIENGHVAIHMFDYEIPCPYGHVGDHLWIRETFYQFGHWEKCEGKKTKTGRMKWKFVADRPDIIFDPPEEFRKGRHHKDPETKAWHKRLGRFMPKSASRITLEITAIRVERLQEMRAGDAEAEGCSASTDCRDNIADYRTLWESINGPGTWDKNPWVWVITFKQIK